MKKYTEQEIIEELGFDEPILNIYQYGSRVYGCNRIDSDYDYIIVTKTLKLKSGAFRQNAISNAERTIQAVVFSYSGFIDAINNYEMNALECLFLEEKYIIKETIRFKITKWIPKELIKKVISKASNSFHIADRQAKDEQPIAAKKGIFQALRILMFGLQLKEHGKIMDYTVANYIRKEFDEIDDEKFDSRDYMPKRDKLIEEFKKIIMIKFNDLNKFAITNVYDFLKPYDINTPNIEGYTVIFGNIYLGYHFKKEEFNPNIWKFLVKMSYYNNGDIALYYNGIICRSVINAKEKILNKNIRYPIRYTKYDIQ